MLYPITKRFIVLAIVIASPRFISAIMSYWSSSLPMDDLFEACAKIANATATGSDIFDQYVHDLTGPNVRSSRVMSTLPGVELYSQKYRNGTLIYKSVHAAATHYKFYTPQVVDSLKKISRTCRSDDLRWMKPGLRHLKAGLFNDTYKSYSRGFWSFGGSDLLQRAFRRELESHMLELADSILMHDAHNEMREFPKVTHNSTFFVLPAYRNYLLNTIRNERSHCQDQLESGTGDSAGVDSDKRYALLSPVFEFFDQPNPRKAKNRVTEAANTCIADMNQLEKNIPILQREAFDRHLKLLNDAVALARRAKGSLNAWGTMEELNGKMVEKRRKDVTALWEKVQGVHAKPLG